MLTFQFDAFNGVIITLDAPYTTDIQSNNTQSTHLVSLQDQFQQALRSLLDLATEQKKQLIWITLPIEASLFIAELTQKGFVFHNCLEDEITLILRLEPDAYAPFVPTHSIGGGGVVLNNNDQVLLIKDTFSGTLGYKLPGGHIELGESIEEGVQREVLEETGIKTEFISIAGTLNKHPYRFNKSNIYFACLLKPLTHNIIIGDPDEIEDAKWFNVVDYIKDENHSSFNRQLVEHVYREYKQGQYGLKKKELAHSSSNNTQRQVYLTS